MITDHSKYVKIPNDMDEKRLLKHIEKIREIDSNNPEIKVLAGVKVDILKDGELDLEEYVLKDCPNF